MVIGSQHAHTHLCQIIVSHARSQYHPSTEAKAACVYQKWEEGRRRLWGRQDRAVWQPPLSPICPPVPSRLLPSIPPSPGLQLALSTPHATAPPFLPACLDSSARP